MWNVRQERLRGRPQGKGRTRYVDHPCGPGRGRGPYWGPQWGPARRDRAASGTTGADRAATPFAWHVADPLGRTSRRRSEEHTSELQSRENLVCRLLLEKKK